MIIRNSSFTSLWLMRGRVPLLISKVAYASHAGSEVHVLPYCSNFPSLGKLHYLHLFDFLNLGHSLNIEYLYNLAIYTLTT